jgi:hypothetical protein
LATVPLTPAHAAIAWPLSRLTPRLPLAALVIGMLSPDFEYLLRLAPRGNWSHTLTGVAAFCLPVSLAAWLVFRAVVKPALVGLLPRAMASTLATPRRELPWLRYFWALVAVTLGALTHLIWDAATHEYGWVVTAYPALRERVLPSTFGPMPLYRLLQHASTAGGLVVTFIWTWRAWTQFPREARRFSPNEAARAQRVAITLLAMTAAAAFLNGIRVWAFSTTIILGFAAVGAMVGLVLATLGYALVTQARNRSASR